MWMYNTSVFPILLYRSETWPLTQRLTKKCNTFSAHCLRMIEHIRWQDHIASEEVCVRMKQALAHVIVAKGWLHWYGHLMCGP